MALRSGAYSPEEVAIAKRMRDMRFTYKVIGCALNRSENSVRKRFNPSTSAAVQALRKVKKISHAAREAEMLRRVIADDGFPRVEMVNGQSAWVYSFERAA